MGGLLAHSKQWQKFEQNFASAQKAHNFRVFHTIKFKKRDGEFKKWTDAQCAALLNELPILIGSGLTDAVCVTLHNDSYNKFYQSGNDKPKKVRLDSKYGLCFRMCLYHFVLEVAKRQHKNEFPHLNIVLENGPKNIGDAGRIFSEVKDELNAMGVDILQTLTQADKGSCGQLMMADFFAHTQFMAATNQLPRTGDVAPTYVRELRKGETSIAHYASTPEGLANIRAHLISTFLASKNTRVRTKQQS